MLQKTLNVVEISRHTLWYIDLFFPTPFPTSDSFCYTMKFSQVLVKLSRNPFILWSFMSGFYNGLHFSVQNCSWYHHKWNSISAYVVLIYRKIFPRSAIHYWIFSIAVVFYRHVFACCSFFVLLTSAFRGVVKYKSYDTV